MGLNVYLEKVMPTTVYGGSVTHNLTEMADAAGLYEALWRPEEIGVVKAMQLIPLLETGLGELTSNPNKYEEYNPENGWGSYEGLCEFVSSYLQACKDNPDADVSVCR